MDTQVDDGALPRLDDLFLDLLTHLRDDLFNAGRVDTAVLDELMQCQTCYLTAHGVKATEDDGFGGVVDDDLDTGSSLEGADVTPLTADDTALDLIALDVEDGDGVLDSRLGSQALDRLYDDALGLLVGGHLRFFDDLVDIALSLVLGFGAKALDKTLTRLVSRESAEGFEALLLALTEELQLSLLLLVLGLLDVVFFLLQLNALTLQGELFLEYIDLLVALLYLIVALRELLLAGLQSTLDLLELIIALCHLLLEVALELQELLLDLKELLLLEDFSFTLRLTEDCTSLLPEELLRDDPRESRTEDKRTDADDNDRNCSHSFV